MIELRLEKTQNERAYGLGEAWIRAITEGALDRFEQLCRPDVSSRLLTPKKSFSHETAGELVEKYRQWFGACSGFFVEQRRIETIGERLGVFVRFFLLEEGQPYQVEQQMYCTLQDGRIASLQVLCSGFHLVNQEEPDSADVLETQGPSPP